MSRKSKGSHQFVFSTADKLVYEDLNFDRYEESIEQLGLESIRKYIEDEALNVQAEQENNVSKIIIRRRRHSI